MEELATVARALCLGLCVCGVGVGIIAAIVLSVVGGGLISTIKDILGIGQRDEDELIDETLESIHQKRNALQNRRSKIVGDGGIPDFDAAVAKYSDGSLNPTSGDFSSQSLDDPSRPSMLDGTGSSDRSGNLRSGGLRKRNRRNNDDYEIYDDGDFFGE